MTVALALVALSIPPAARAQEDGSARTACAGELAVHEVHGIVRDYARTLQLSGAVRPGSESVRRPSTDPYVRGCSRGSTAPWSAPTAPSEFRILEVIRRERPPSEAHPSLRVLPFSAYNVFNSGYPDDRNNGALWAGKGLASAFSGGLRLEWGPLSVGAAPLVQYQENRDFVFPTVEGIQDFGLHRLSNAFYPARIDYPLRHGDLSSWAVDPGQSYVRLDLGPVALGGSTENLWWGPGIRNALLLSNTAAGFPHAFLGTSGPVDISIGRLEVEAVWGQLEESHFFDFIPGNDHRLLAGAIVTYEPKWIPGLFVGVARTVQRNQGFEATDIFPLFGPWFRETIPPDETAPLQPAEQDDLTSLFARLVLPDTGFELYFEWAREKLPQDFHDLLTRADESQGYTLGLQQLLEAGDGYVRILGEITHLQEKDIGPLRRQTAIFYAGSEVPQGHTHEGQLLGAGIGPGADAQFIGVDYFGGWGSVGGYVERVRRNELAPAAVLARVDFPFRHDVEVTFGATWTALLPRDLLLSGGLAYSHRDDIFFRTADLDGDGFPEGLDGTNWELTLRLDWRPELESILR